MRLMLFLHKTAGVAVRLFGLKYRQYTDATMQIIYRAFPSDPNVEVKALVDIWRGGSGIDETL